MRIFSLGRMVSPGCPPDVSDKLFGRRRDRGNSEGWLINAQGELAGINVARLGHSEAGSFGFTVPASTRGIGGTGGMSGPALGG
jgi:hypothetical protein